MQYVDREKLASEAQIAADVAFCRVAAMPYPAYDRGLSAWGFVGPISEAPPGNKLTFESEIYPHGQNIRQRRLIWLRSYREVMVVGEGLLSALRFALRVVACGNAFSLRSNRTLIEASRPSPHGQNIG
jgi:hypothetical protein